MDRRTALAAAATALAAAVPAVASAASAKKNEGSSVTYVPVKSISATIMRRDGSRGVITMECGLDINDETLRLRANQLQPRLRDAYASTLQTYVGGLPRAALPNADYLVGEMQKATDRVLGKKGGKFLVGTIMVT
jgi:hypothetical protein